ncbi:MAG: nickel-dependent hydrogenase large subunit [Candidatus Desulfofervidaceae bacterium]|nr:nickel-dependent hydrogenase large subunit [Candidatus Desulfofervidaceae bacterium]
MAGAKPKQIHPRRVIIDPITRIEGHMKVEVELQGDKVINAWSSGTLFRGMEIILRGRDPRDATQITQRICGVCPIDHAVASATALEDAFGIRPPTNGRIMRNLTLGAHWLYDHILHFYHLAALDFVKGPDVPPFIPCYDGKGVYKLDPKTNEKAVKSYLRALEVKTIAQEMVAMVGGRAPHCHGIVVGGQTQLLTPDAVPGFLWRLEEVKAFIDNEYLPTVYAIAKVYPECFKTGVGCKNVLSYGVFPLNDERTEFLFKPGVYTNGQDKPLDPEKIVEDVKYSWYADNTSGLKPMTGKTEAQLGKPSAYTYIKAPRYAGLPHEVGPLARMWVTNPVLSKHANRFLGVSEDRPVRFRDLGDKAFSTLGRHIARAEETWCVANILAEWVKQLDFKAPHYLKVDVPERGEGMGLSEAARGALGHFIVIQNHKIANYQCVVPTTWNASPRDDKGQLGPIEQAILGTPVPDPENPVEVVRIVRSFDPCLACAVHLLRTNKNIVIR